MDDIKNALIALKADGLRCAAAWQQAHELAQAHEGEPAYDHLHAVLHRIEGDQPNAAYWYRRAGEPICADGIAAEVDRLIERAAA